MTPRLRHLPPVATPVRPGDAWRALGAARDPGAARARFRAAMLRRTGAAECFLVSSGRAALALILLGLKELSARRRVVVPAYGCPTVVQAVLAAGLEPVFCDVSPRTLDLEPEALARLLDRETLAVIVVHLYGLAQDVADLLEACRSLEIFVVEDAAQALGARFGGALVGTRGDAGLCSLGRGKCLPAGGGGVLVAQASCAAAIGGAVARCAAPPAREQGLAAAIGHLAYGLATHPRGWWFLARTPLNPAKEGMDVEKLPPIQLERLPAARAGIATVLLERLDMVQATNRLHAAVLMEGLAGLPDLALPRIPAAADPAFLRLPIILADSARAERLYARLWQAGIGVSRSYYRTLPDLYAARLPVRGEAYPGAARLATDMLTLPTHPHLDDSDLTRIVEICTALGKGRKR